MAGGVATNPEQTLTSFASLLSSALTVGGSEPLAGSSSALPCFFSSSVPNSEMCASLPSLNLKNKELPQSAEATAGMGLEEAAAFNLAIPILCRKSELPDAPGRILANVSASFVRLIDARMRSSIAALLKQTLAATQRAAAAGGRRSVDAQSSLLLGLLSNSTPVAPTTVVTSFRVLPTGEGSSHNARIGGGGVILPLVFEAVVDLSVLGSLVTIPLRSPGTITGTFDADGDRLLRTVDMAFDTLAFLRAMMKQARFVVRRAVTVASGIAGTLAAATAKGRAGAESGSGGDEDKDSSKDKRQNSAFVKTLPPPRFPSNDCGGEGGPSEAAQGDGCGALQPASESPSPAPSSLSSTTAPSSSLTGRPYGSENDLMPPPPPRKPLHSSRSSPGLHFSAHSCRGSDSGLSSLAVMPPGLRTSERGPSSELRNAGHVHHYHQEASGEDDRKNAEWGTPPPPASAATTAASIDSSAAAQGLALLGKVSLGLKRAREVKDADRASRSQETDKEGGGEPSGPGKKRKVQPLPLRKRRVFSCPSTA